MKYLSLLLLLIFSIQAYGDSVDIPVNGLYQQATIRVDEWGVAYIDAGAEYDAYFAQGFNIARERLWQIDLWRKRGYVVFHRDDLWLLLGL